MTMNRKQTLEVAHDVVYSRGHLYGSLGDNFTDIADMWSTIIGKDLSPHHVALCMAALKIVRAKDNPSHDDSWVDIAGYAACGAECVHIATESLCVSETASEAPEVAEKENANTDPAPEGCGAYTIRQAYRAMGSPPPARYGCSKCKQEWREGQAKPCETDMADDIGTPTSEQNQAGSDDGWIEHDGSETCPLFDGDIRVDIVGVDVGTDSDHWRAEATPARVVRWQNAKRWRVAEVDGWIRQKDGEAVRMADIPKSIDIILLTGAIRYGVGRASLYDPLTQVVAYRSAADAQPTSPRKPTGWANGEKS